MSIFMQYRMTMEERREALVERREEMTTMILARRAAAPLALERVLARDPAKDLEAWIIQVIQAVAVVLVVAVVVMANAMMLAHQICQYRAALATVSPKMPVGKLQFSMSFLLLSTPRHLLSHIPNCFDSACSSDLILPPIVAITYGDHS